jgi:hypothetical protein
MLTRQDVLTLAQLVDDRWRRLDQERRHSPLYVYSLSLLDEQQALEALKERLLDLLSPELTITTEAINQ